MMKTRNTTAAAALFLTMLVSATGAFAQSSNSQLDGSATNSASNAQVSGITAQNSVGNDASSMSGGNVFDFSNKSQSMGMAPSLPSFAGGACMGVSGGVSASLPGFGIGGGRSFDDESCQRRNWVQTLIGAAEHMPETESNELKRVAIVVMMQDKILAPAFRELGYNVDAPGTEVSSAHPSANVAVPTAAAAPARQIEPKIGAMASNCTVVLPKSASPAFAALVERRGCTITRR
jgi:hypothetical protein